eukprot:4298365-Alexandrium_andersonii.AAC.1
MRVAYAQRCAVGQGCACERVCTYANWQGLVMIAVCVASRPEPSWPDSHAANCVGPFNNVRGDRAAPFWH